MVFARNRAGNLTSHSDSHGIFIAADLGKTAAARELWLKPLTRGLLTA